MITNDSSTENKSLGIEFMYHAIQYCLIITFDRGNWLSIESPILNENMDIAFVYLCIP